MRVPGQRLGIGAEQPILKEMKSSDIGLAGYQIEKVSRCGDYEIQASFDSRPRSCPRCGSQKLVSKGPYSRAARHLDAFGFPSRMQITLRRWQCKECRRTFVPELPGLRPGHRSTEPFRRKIYESHHDGICASRLALREGLGSASVCRIYAEFTYLKAQERKNQTCPRVLGIDEHTLHRGQRFVTTFCNLKNRRVFDVVEGKSQVDLLAFLRTLKGREKVKVVCIDLSSSYRQVIQKWFPNAKIVADRFHVTRIIQHHFLGFCRMLVPELKNKRGLLKSLRKNPENLTQRDQERLQAFLYLPARDQGAVSQTAQAARAPEAQDSLQRVLSPKDPRIDGATSRPHGLRP